MKDNKPKNTGRKIMSIVNVLWIASLILVVAVVVVWISVILEAYKYFDSEFRAVYIIGVVLSTLILLALLYLKKSLYYGFGLMIEKTESMERELIEIRKAAVNKPCLKKNDSEEQEV